MILIFFPVQFNFIPFNSNLSHDDNPNIILPLNIFLLHTRSSLYYYRIKPLNHRGVLIFYVAGSFFFLRDMILAPFIIFEFLKHDLPF